MVGKNVVKKPLKSMKEFERLYYPPNHLGGYEPKSPNHDPSLGRKFANETFTQIRKSTE